MKQIECRQAEKWIIEDLDLGLLSERVEVLDNHCRQCASCRDMRNEMNTLLAAIAADVPQDPGEDYWKHFHTSLEARLQEKQSAPRWWFPWRVAVAAALAVLVLFAVTLVRYDGTEKVVALRQHDSAPELVEISKVIGELYQIYGPVSEETSTSASLPDQPLLLVDGRGVPDDAIIGWFEVEYEPNHILL